MRKGYVLETALLLLVAVAIFVAAIVSFVSNTSSLRVSQEKLVIASNDARNGLQMGTSYVSHFANAISGFGLNFNGTGSVPFSSISWLKLNTPNNFFNAIYSSSDGVGWKKALSTLATDGNVIYLNKIQKVKTFFQTLKASGTFSSIPDVVVIQTKIGGYTNTSKYFVVSRAVVGGKVAYASGFVLANGLNRYVYFTDIEPPYERPYYNVTFLTGDVVDGPVRTNSTLVTLGKPDFKSYVQYGDLEKVSGTPNFESGSSQLSQADINSMNMSMIASKYRNQINSEVASPITIKSAGLTSTPVGLDLSVVYDNLLNKKWKGYGFNDWQDYWWYGMPPYKWDEGGYYTLSTLVNDFKYDFNNWEYWNGIQWDELPKVIQNDYNNVISSIKGIPSLQVTFSPGNSGSNSHTITIKYGIDTSNSCAAIEHLIFDVDMYSYMYSLSSIEPYISGIHDLLTKCYATPQWHNLLTINSPDGVPGTSTISIESDSASLLGLKNNKDITFNFNGVIKTTSDLVIGDDTDQLVSGKYTLYTTRSSIINGNIVYNYANKLFAAKKHWLRKKVSTSMVAEIRAATGTDFLNIVSNYDVALAKSMPKHAKIMASIYAFNGTFWFPNYEYAPVGQLFQYGSTAQYEGGQLFGTYSDNSLTTGYHTYDAFDWRILGGLPSNMYGTPSAQNKALLMAVRTTF